MAETVDSIIGLVRKISNVGTYKMREADESQAPGHLKQGAAFWRNAVKNGDDLLEGTQEVALWLEKAADTEGQRQRGYLVDVRNSINKVKAVSGEFYGDFKNGREELYAAAKIWDMSTRRTGKGTVKSKPLTGDDDGKLMSSMSRGADNLASSMGQMLEMGSKATTAMKKCAASGCTDPSEREDVLTKGLDFRDLVSEAVFGRVNGIMRRAAELMVRYDAAVEENLHESKVVWIAPWENDPEIGSGEKL
jgi:hypothetical protein